MIDPATKDIFKLAVEAQGNGNFHQAARLYFAVLEQQPNHPDTNHNVGVVAAKLGKQREAVLFSREQRNLMHWSNNIGLVMSMP